MQFDLFDDTHNRILSATSYGEFSESLRASACRRCGLHRRRGRIVVDRGNPGAPILVVSERPGENEDRLGQAFVGRAGEMLDKIFKAIELDSNRDVLITNVVKCMPEVDRSPFAEEVRACLPYLEKQIALIRPAVLLLLGAVALKYISPQRSEIKMEDEAGRFFTMEGYPGIQFMVLYHPAFLLRDPRKKKDMWQHAKRLRDFLKERGLHPAVRV